MRKLMELLESWIFDDESMFLFLAKMFFVIATPIVLIIGVAFYLDSKQPHFTLNKSEWTCEEKHYEKHTQFIMAGKVMVPITSDIEVCDNYSRIK